jgi:hypothetical protein
MHLLKQNRVELHHHIQVYQEINRSTSDQPLFALDGLIETNHGDVNFI